MAAEKKSGTSKTAADSSKSSRNTRSAARRVAQRSAAAPQGPVELSPAQQEIKDAKSGTSDIAAGGAEKAKENEIRMESEGVLTPIKSDFDNPESPVVGDPSGALVGPKDPEPVKIGPGETAAQHEAHALMNHPARIAERIKLESGEKGLPTDVIARRQQEDIASLEFQRVEGDRPVDAAQQERLKAQEGRESASADSK